MRHKTLQTYFFYTEIFAVQTHDNFVVVYTDNAKTDHVIKLSGFHAMDDKDKKYIWRSTQIFRILFHISRIGQI